ncbi:hypothetical protein D3C79_723800 [compost metagenome]
MVPTVGVVLQVGLQGERGVFAEVYADGRRDGVAFFLVVIELRVRGIRQACQAISDALVVIHRAAEVETHATLALGADCGLNLMVGGKQRLLGGQGDQAPWRASPIQYRRRSLENIDALKEVRVHLHGAVGSVIAHRLEPVDVDVVYRTVVETTHGHIVITMGRTVGVGQHPRCVAHGLGDGLGALVVHLLTGDHRDRLRCLYQWHAGLGRNLAVGSVVTLHAAQRIAKGEATDIGVWQ